MDRLEIPTTFMSNIVYLNLEKNNLPWTEINKLRFLKK